jgi:hypothetical protein
MSSGAANKQKKDADARAGAATAIATEMVAVTDMEKAQTDAQTAVLNRDANADRFQRVIEKEVKEQEQFRLDSQLREKLTQLAIDEGVDINVLMTLVQKERLDELELKRITGEAQIRIEAAVIYEIRRYHEVLMIGKTLDGLFKEIDDIRSSNHSEFLKEKMIGEREEDIKFLQEDRRAKRQRLLQAHNGEDADGRGAGSTDDRGDPERTVRPTEEQVPTEKRGVGRPRKNSNK